MKRFHEQRDVDTVLLHLVAIALVTGRTLILPHAFDSQRQLMAWQVNKRS